MKNSSSIIFYLVQWSFSDSGTQMSLRTMMSSIPTHVNGIATWNSCYIQVCYWPPCVSAPIYAMLPSWRPPMTNKQIKLLFCSLFHFCLHILFFLFQIYVAKAMDKLKNTITKKIQDLGESINTSFDEDARVSLFISFFCYYCSLFLDGRHVWICSESVWR